MLIKAILIGLVGYLGSLSVPWFFGTTGGWYTLSRPLVSGMIVGFILGDVQQGIIIGVGVQAVYIAMVTPGGTIPADLNFVAYPAIALAIMSGADTDTAVALASTIGILGTVVHNFMMTINSFYNHLGDNYAEEGDMFGIVKANAIYPQLTTFLLRFIPTFLAIYLGGGYIKEFVNALPQVINHVLNVVGGMLPAVGIGILLKQVIKDYSYFAYFLVGFAMMAYLDINMVALTIVGVLIAVMHYKYGTVDETAEGGAI